MIYDEDDIDFLKLSDSQFEEVCYELLVQLGYKNLVWRQGGADNGRDIEGWFAIDNPLVGTHDEKWFFECKRYEAGVPPEQLNSKIAWADAEKPKRLVFFVSSYLSNNARTWLEKIASGKPYSVHIVEGKQLKQVIFKHPELITRYFLNPYKKLLSDIFKTWLQHDILPNSEVIDILLPNLEPIKLSIGELALICCIVNPHGDEYVQPIALHESPNPKRFFDRLIQLANSSVSLMPEPYKGLVSQNLGGELEYLRIVTPKPKATIYSLVQLTTDSGIEILIEGNENFPTQIRYIANGIQDEMAQTRWKILKISRGSE